MAGRLSRYFELRSLLLVCLSILSLVYLAHQSSQECAAKKGWTICTAFLHGLSDFDGLVIRLEDTKRADAYFGLLLFPNDAAGISA